MKTMKVLRINTTVTEGGAALSTINIQKAVAALGVETWVLSARNPQNLSMKILTLGETKFRLVVNVLAYRALGIEGFANRSLWRSVLARLDEFDLIHLHNVHGYYMPFNVLRTLLLKPCVWTLHDFWLVTGGPGFPSPPLENRTGIERLLPFANFRYPIEWFDRSIKRRRILFKLIAQHNPSLVAISHVMAERLYSMGLPSPDLNVIPHGLYDSELGPSAVDRSQARGKKCWPLDQHVFLFSSAQVDNPVKGCDVFLSALKILPAKNTWVAYVIGAKSEAAKRRANALGLNVQFIGKISESEMRECYRACDTYVTSTFDETFGRAVVEALAEGAEVVCTDLPVLREVSGGNAIYFPAGDAEALGHELYRLLQHPAQSDRQSIANKIRGNFSKQLMATKYINLYEAEIERKNINKV